MAVSRCEIKPPEGLGCLTVPRTYRAQWERLCCNHNASVNAEYEASFSAERKRCCILSLLNHVSFFSEKKNANDAAHAFCRRNALHNANSLAFLTRKSSAADRVYTQGEMLSALTSSQHRKGGSDLSLPFLFITRCSHCLFLLTQEPQAHCWGCFEGQKGEKAEVPTDCCMSVLRWLSVPPGGDGVPTALSDGPFSLCLIKIVSSSDENGAFLCLRGFYQCFFEHLVGLKQTKRTGS